MAEKSSEQKCSSIKILKDRINKVERKSDIMIFAYIVVLMLCIVFEEFGVVPGFALQYYMATAGLGLALSSNFIIVGKMIDSTDESEEEIKSLYKLYKLFELIMKLIVSSIAIVTALSVLA